MRRTFRNQIHQFTHPISNNPITVSIRSRSNRAKEFKENLEMKMIAISLLSAAVLGGGWLAYHAREASANTGEMKPGKGSPVIVELFTSEGCSSCPSADKVLARLIREQNVSGANIIALSEHVDYWNSLGWKDPFSSEIYTNRQHEYARKMRLASIYTPQMVVDGQKEFVGSDEEVARQSIAKAAKQPKADIMFEDNPEKRAMQTKPGINIPFTVQNLPAVQKGDEAEVFLAIVQDSANTKVRAGENSGSSLDHVSILRTLARAGAIASSSSSSFKGNATFGTDHYDFRATPSHLTVFIQERKSRRILGAASLKI